MHQQNIPLNPELEQYTSDGEEKKLNISRSLRWQILQDSNSKTVSH